MQATHCGPRKGLTLVYSVNYGIQQIGLGIACMQGCLTALVAAICAAPNDRIWVVPCAS